MGSKALDSDLADAIDMANASLDGLFASGLDPVDGKDASQVVAELERLSRRLDAAKTAVLDNIDKRALFSTDGYGSAKAMVGHVSKLAPGRAAGMAKAARMCRELPSIAAHWRAGKIGTDQVMLLARVFANPRVQKAMPARQDRFITAAASKPYSRFEQSVRNWERITDQDGATPAIERPHRDRDAKLVQDHFDLGWKLRASTGSFDGAMMKEVLDHFIEAEWRTDWEKARAEHGDNTAEVHLCRTHAQRRADALAQIFRSAASAAPDAKAPNIVHNIVWSQETYETMLARVAGAGEAPLDPDRYRCSTLDGVEVDPTEAVLDSLVSHVRRVVVDTKGVVIDLGRKARLFTGSARDAALLQATHCVWPGCSVPSSRCEVDHLLPHSQGGSTCPSNGAPLCGKHNRWKQKGFSTWRDDMGRWRTRRPDGTEIA